MSNEWILGFTRGHNGGACLLKNGEIVFAIEEERLSRLKYDGGPLASILKAKEIIGDEELTYLVVAHTQGMDTAGKIDYTGDDIYSGLCRKIGLLPSHPNEAMKKVIDLSHVHHKLHAACAFYRSGFKDATAVIIDGAGTFSNISSPNFGPQNTNGLTTFEVESIIDCNYPAVFRNVYKHHGVKEAIRVGTSKMSLPMLFDENDTEEFDITISDRAGIVKCYEAITEYCGFSAIEAGKTMGLFPYGTKDDRLPPLINYKCNTILSDRGAIAPQYPQTGSLQPELFEGFKFSETQDLTKLENRKNAAWWVQVETQKAAAEYIRKAYEITGNKNIVVSGGYGLNCVANYFYREELKDLIDEGVNIYCEPISSDAGTAIGAAMIVQRFMSGNQEVQDLSSLYLGPTYDLNSEKIKDIVDSHNWDITIKEGVNNSEVVDIITDKNIVAIWQGRSENGPRALGNRSLLYDASDPNGKDFVNTVKNREYFRPFAGSILEEDAHEWFDMRGLSNSPDMMYAVNAKDGIKEKIPSIIHVDNTCRIQTVNKEQNPNYYDLIKAFKDKTGCPIVFNTSFNLGGEPLVETLDDAVRTLVNSDIEYLYLPEYKTLITVNNQEIL